MSSPNNSGRFSRPTAPDRAGTLVALAEALFDEITRQAAQACGSQAAALSLVEDGHHWFKSRGGVSPAETPRAIALCAETIRRKGILQLADVREDERFAGGPDDPRNIRFFAGAPIITARAGAIGTISVMDTAVRELDAGAAHIARRAGARSGPAVRHPAGRQRGPGQRRARGAGPADGGDRAGVPPPRRAAPARHVPDPGRALPLRQPQARGDPRLRAVGPRRSRRRDAGRGRRPPDRARTHPRGPGRQRRGALHVQGDPQGRGAHRRGGPRDGQRDRRPGRAHRLDARRDRTQAGRGPGCRARLRGPAHAPAQPRAVHGAARDGARPVAPVRAEAGRGAPAISTSSSSSTTTGATTSATGCCSRSRCG